MPLTGILVGTLIDIVNLAFIRQFPLEMWYLSCVYTLFGGVPVYYLGHYAFGASITEPDERTTRLTR